MASPKLLPEEENLKAFLTGSHAYGIPRKDSDIDLVILISEEDFEKLRLLSDEPDHEADYISAGGKPLRFGRLNLLCCMYRKGFDVWRKGTKRLKRNKIKVSRDAAIEFFRELRREAGFFQ